MNSLHFYRSKTNQCSDFLSSRQLVAIRIAGQVQSVRAIENLVSVRQRSAEYSVDVPVYFVEVAWPPVINCERRSHIDIEVILNADQVRSGGFDIGSYIL